ncbi:tRNA CCA-pyrophosphorylase, partial [Halobacteriales archaeon SW_12_71_31]
PFLDGDRYVVERDREYTTPDGAVEGLLFDVGLGPDVQRAVEEDHAVLVGESVADLAERDGLARALREYFEPRP